jgi:uncharacterized protein YdiU (UPF0061 family)
VCMALTHLRVGTCERLCSQRQLPPYERLQAHPAAGSIHGVLNTDTMSLAGESFD